MEIATLITVAVGFLCSAVALFEAIAGKIETRKAVQTATAAGKEVERCAKIDRDEHQALFGMVRDMQATIEILAKPQAELQQDYAALLQVATQQETDIDRLKRQVDALSMALGEKRK